MIWLLGSSVVVLASVFATVALYTSGQFDRRSWWIPAAGVLALPVLGFAAAITGLGHGERTASGVAPLAPASSIAWPGSMQARPAAVPMTTDQGRVAPVSSLVEGLKARLEQSPDDAEGWALLATSYAFVGERAGAEEAVARAVALGVDEAALRERVAAASGSQPSASNNSIDTALGR